jgi:DNA invertase Pin-like site-specific DNA recombinase
MIYGYARVSTEAQDLTDSTAQLKARTARGRADAKAKGVKFGRKPKLTPHQEREAQQRIAAGETQRSIARSFNVSQATISRLSLLPRPSPVGAVRIAGDRP